jgi:nucleotide-binding universal stress UspA family protein
MTDTMDLLDHASQPDAGVIRTVRQALDGPLVIAGSTDESMCGALRLAELLTRRDRVAAHVLGVVRPTGFPVWAFADVDPEALEDGRRRQHLERVRQRVHQTVGRSGRFTVNVVSGSPTRALASEARGIGAAYILVGLAEEGTSERRTGEDAVLHVARSTDVPVLAVPVGCARLPASALLATDFSPASWSAAGAAMRVLAPGATLTLAHVEPEADLRDLGQEGWVRIYERGVTGLFEELAGALRAARDDVRIESVLLKGDPVPALLEYAARRACELIASGAQSASDIGDPFTGSVSTALLRGARCCVLIAPAGVPGGR